MALIQERVELARQGQNPAVMCKLRSGWAVMGDVQFLPGYSLLLLGVRHGTGGAAEVRLLGHVAGLRESHPQEGPNALHILDRFHIVQNLGKAIDKIRAAEVRELASKGYDEDVLKRTKYCFLKKEENLTDT